MEPMGRRRIEPKAHFLTLNPDSLQAPESKSSWHDKHKASIVGSDRTPAFSRKRSRQFLFVGHRCFLSN